MIDAGLLKILCCPETHQPLHPADVALVDKLNRSIAASGLRNRAGQLVKDTLEGGLVREDGKFLYPIQQGVPVMLVDEAVPLAD